MTNRISLCLPTSRQINHFFILTTLLIFSCALIIKGQPEFSKKELSLIKERKYISNNLKYHLPQDKFPMPEISNQNNTIMADGNIDSTFNVSATEGFGYVNKTVAQSDGKIIAVGLFQRANGTRTNGITRFNADGTLDTSFNSGSGANLAIRAVALQPDGKIIIGGAFTSFNNQTVNRIVRLNSDGSIDSSFSLTVAFNNQINDISVLSNGKIMVGGQFSLSSTRLVRLNSNGTLDSVISGFNGTVHTIALASDGKIVVGGEFSLPRPTIARLNSDGTVDSFFNPSSGGDGSVYKALVQPNGKIIAAGVFRSFNGVSNDGVVRLNDNGLIDATFEITNDPNVQNLNVSGLALQPDGKLLVGFFDDAYASIADVRRFNADASPDSTFNTNSNNSIIVIDLNLLADGKVIASGYFTTVSNQPHLRIVKLDSFGNVDNSFNPSASSVGIVYAIKRQADGKIIIGGDFEYVNGVPKRAIARLNSDGSLDNTFTIGSGFFGDIYAIEIQPDNKIIIGGLFSGDPYFPAYAAARLNSNGSLSVSLNNNSNFIGVAYALALQTDGKIIVGGQVFDINFNPIAATRLNSNGILDGSFTPSSLPNGTIRAISIQTSGKIIIGGTFFYNAAFQRTGLARLNNNGTLDDTIFGGNSNVASIKIQNDGTVVAAGSFLTRCNSEGVNDTTLNTGTGFNSQIRAVEIQPDGKILLGGFFTTYNGNAVNRLIRINSNGALDSTFNTGVGPTGTVFSLNLQPDGKVLAGGQFLDFNGTEKLSVVRLQNSAIRKPSPFDFDGDGKSDISIFRPNSGEWWYYRSSDGQVPAVRFGSSSDKIVPGDYTGDGKTDVAFWQPSSGYWFIVRSENNSFFSFPFGSAGDVPVPADYDGDGKTDPAVFRPSTNTWYISLTSGGTSIFQFGTAGDVPVVGDYDGDGKADIAIFRPSSGQWWISRSTAGLAVATFGTATDKPVQGDFTGDGKTDIAIWRPSTGEWFVLRSEDSSFFSIPFGTNGDIPTAGDYDGDGKFDFAVFRPSGATWYVQRSTAGLAIQQFGLSSDRPVPAAFVP
jgi:uncharacterized delta-60 repeat protein